MKDTYFFSHDYNARNDPKLQKVLMKHSCAGIGVYWCIVEQIYEQGGVLPLTDCESIAFALHVDAQVVESIVKDFDLFHNDGETFWSESVNDRLNRRADIAEKRKQAAASSWESRRAKQLQSNEDANAMGCNANKGKERTVKNSKENNNTESNKLDSSENDFSGASESLNNQSDSSSSESEQKEKSSGKKEKVDFAAVVELYHQKCPSYPRIIKLSDARKQKIQIRVEEMKFDFALLESIFTSMEKSKFLRGDNKNGWKATFDWVFENEKNWVKIAEGNYNDNIKRDEHGNKLGSDTKGVSTAGGRKSTL